MIKVLLIDDEEIILLGLKKLIDWQSLGLEVVGTATDGESGLKITETLRPDIVITDIKMYDMSGLDFAEKYLAVNPECKIIVLTGYSEFEYARRAVNLGLFAYLLKPIDKNELCQCLESAAAEIEKVKGVRAEGTVNAKKAVRRAFFEGFTEETGIKLPEQDFSGAEGQLLKTVVYGPADRIPAEVDELERHILFEYGLDEVKVRTAAAAFAVKLASELEKNGENAEEARELVKEIAAAERWADIKLLFAERLKGICHDVRAISAAKKRDVVEMAKAFIDENYAKPISIEILTSRLYITATYFCYLFKQRAGIGYHEYLLKKRMTEAIKLVASNKYKIYEIAEMVGYGNARYFSEVFKKYYGILPTEFDIETHRELLENAGERGKASPKNNTDGD